MKLNQFKPCLLLASALLAPSLSASFGQATPPSRVLHVGPGQQFALPSQAAAAAQDGDTVDIAAGRYPGDVAVWRANRLTLRGVGGRPTLDAQGKAAGGKGIWVIDGDDTVVENIEFTGATVPDRNGAGIRAEGRGLTIRRCFFHDNEDGVLANNSLDGDLLIEDCEFAHNGQGDGYSHNMYIGHVRRFTLRGCYVHDSYVGHDVKSRAAVTQIFDNRISDDATSNSSFLIDLPNGGDCVLIGNILRRGPNAANATLVSFAEEGAVNSQQSLSVVNNTFVSDRPTATDIRVVGSPMLRVLNNIFAGTATEVEGTAIVMSHNVRASATDFQDSQNGDYHLAVGSVARGAGTSPGKADGMDLTPRFQYHSPLGTEPRPAKNPLDAGAFAAS